MAEAFVEMGRNRLTELLNGIKKVRAVLVGDVCVDIYWSADMTRSVLSRETPHFPLPVTQERITPGAGGNAAANLMALSPKALSVIGVTGDDWRGDCLRASFSRAGISPELLVGVPGRFTNAYCKPMRRGYSGEETEDPRIDFESFEPLPKEAEAELIERLEKAAASADVLCVSDQFANGCITAAVRERINGLAAEGLLVVADSRLRIAEFRGAVLKPNELECARAAGYDERLCAEGELLHAEAAAQRLAELTGSDVCLTLGKRGCLIRSAEGCVHVHAVTVEPPVDTVGAGDCFLSAFSLALAAGASYPEAGRLACLAASVSVKKLGVTGTASADEILRRYDGAETQ